MKRVKYPISGLLLAVALVFTACTTGNKTATPTATDTPAFTGTPTPTVTPATTNTPVAAPVFQNVSPQEAAELIEDSGNGSGFTILDVRTPEEYAAGHIEGAVNLDFYAADFRDGLERLDKSAAYFVYCRSGKRSEQATQMMEELGFSEVYNLSGGMNDWTAAGLPTIK